MILTGMESNNIYIYRSVYELQAPLAAALYNCVTFHSFKKSTYTVTLRLQGR